MLLVGGSGIAAQPGLLELRDSLRQLSPRGGAAARRFQDGGAQKLSYKLKLVGRKATEETTDFGAERWIGSGNQGGHQSTSHGKTPVK